MSSQDPIADMIVRVKNALAVRKKTVSMPKSKLKVAIAKVLESEGYIDGYSETAEDNKPSLTIELKYFENAPVIRAFKKVSGPSLRVYASKDELPVVDNGLGVAIISTSQGGVMTAQQATLAGLGGEILCYVS